MTKEYIERGAVLEQAVKLPEYNTPMVSVYAIQAATAADVVEVSAIKAYLQSKLDEWNALGDRKFEPANMWGYNFIMACFDDLAKMDGGADNG